MDEYIERSAGVSILRAKANMAVLMDAAPYFEKAAQMLEKLPAADVAPVVHGRWEFLGPNRLIKECMCGTCSACKVRSKYIVNTMLCPNCGAKMDGGADHEDD